MTFASPARCAGRAAITELRLAGIEFDANTLRIVPRPGA
jgi:hypothetical protein